MLEIYIQAKIIINPLFDENALISPDQGLIEDFTVETGRWGLFMSNLRNRMNSNIVSRLLLQKVS